MKSKYFTLLLVIALFLLPSIVLAWTKDDGPYDLIEDLQVSDQGVFYVASYYKDYREVESYGPWCTQDTKVINARGVISKTYDDIYLDINDNNWGYYYDNGNVFNNYNGISGYNIKGVDYPGDCNLSYFGKNKLAISNNSYLATQCLEVAPDPNPPSADITIYGLILNGKQVAKYGSDNALSALAVSDSKEAYILSSRNIVDMGNYSTGIGQYHVVIGDKKYGPYSLATNLVLSNNNWAFIYFEEGSQDLYVMYNGQSYGPYHHNCTNLFDSEDNCQYILDLQSPLF